MIAELQGRKKYSYQPVKRSLKCSWQMCQERDSALCKRSLHESLQSSCFLVAKADPSVRGMEDRPQTRLDHRTSALANKLLSNRVLKLSAVVS